MVRNNIIRVDKEFKDLVDEMRRETGLKSPAYTRQIARAIKRDDIKCKTKRY